MTQPIPVTLIPGDGIGPEVTGAAVAVLKELDVPIQWDIHQAGETGVALNDDPLHPKVVDSIRRNKLCLKGPLATPIGRGYQSVNVQIRRTFDLYANVRPAKTFKGIDTPFKNVDLVIVRENTEGEYSGVEHYVDRHQTVAEAISITTEEGCRRIVRHAYFLARERRKKLSLVHKANILKKTQGMFLATGRKVVSELNEGKKDFSNLLDDEDGTTESERVVLTDLIVDNMAMQLVRNPSRFDVIVTTNLFGDILSDLTAGLVGGLGVVGSANLGPEVAMFEAVHGTAPDIAGKGLANPTAMLMSTVMLLQHIGEETKARLLEEALRYVIACGVETTADIGGKGTTESFTREIVKILGLRGRT